MRELIMNLAGGPFPVHQLRDVVSLVGEVTTHPPTSPNGMRIEPSYLSKSGATLSSNSINTFESDFQHTSVTGDAYIFLSKLNQPIHR